jgi:RHS repeat-associated protein
VAITHSSGDRFLFEYNAAGRLIKLTDHAGRETTYAYDAGDEHLISVTRPDGQSTQYAYVTNADVLRNHHLLSVSPPGGPDVHFSYDALGRLGGQHLAADEESISYAYDSAGKTAVSDAFGNTTAIWLDSRGRTSMVQNPLGYRSQLQYDAASNLTRIVGPTGLTSQFTYDADDNLIVSRDPLGYETAFGYGGPYKDLVWVRDARGNATQYQYDDRGNVTRITYADETYESYQYDGVGNLIASTNRRGQTITYGYNSRGQLISKDYPDTLDTVDFRYAYDTSGNMTSAIGPEGTTAFTYEARTDRLLRIDYPAIAGRSLFFTFRYDTAGRRVQRVDQDGYTLNYTYDAGGRLDTMTDASDSVVVDYDYDAAGRIDLKTLGNGVYTAYEYDPASQLLSLTNRRSDGEVISSFGYTYDWAGQRASMITREGTWSYGYDPLGQLTRVMHPAGREVTYTYDAVGNRTRVKDNAVTTAYTANAMNQYVDVGGVSYTYDVDGNLISEAMNGLTSTYSYDIENRLIAVSMPAGAWTYSYDSIGNRKTSSYNGATTQYIVDPVGLGDVVAEHDASGNLIVRYDHGLGLISRTNASANVGYYLFDAIGNTSELVDQVGHVANRYTYDPFGISLARTETVPNPFEFIGEHGVMDDASGLAFMRARFYSAATGRFVSADPIGLSGGINLYGYTANDPVNAIDPNGLKPTASPSTDDPRSPGAVKISERQEKLLEEIYRRMKQAEDNGSTLKFKVEPPTPVTSPRGRNPTPESIQVASYSPGAYATYLNFLSLSESLSGLAAAWLADGTSHLQHSDQLRPEEWLSSQMSKNFPSAFGKTTLVTSWSPEDKWGPAGYDAPDTAAGAEKRFVSAGGTFNYRIEMWNKPEAPAPTQDATIYDVLDPEVFDLSTFQFTRVGFLKWDQPLAGGQSINIRIDARPDINIAVDVTGTFDPETGRIEWWFHTVDPLTGDYPDDPQAGFLPPFNPETKYEIGWMEFTVKLKDDLTTGTEIANQAFVQFDFFGPWGPAPKDRPWINTIDVGNPASHVLPLADTIRTGQFLVQWTGEDDPGGSGVVSFDVFVSENDGPFAIWRDGTTETSAVFDATDGHTYAFYSIATDGVGHREAAPSMPDARTTFAANRPPTGLELTTAELAENEPAGTLIGEFSTVDPDLDETFTYELADSESYPDNLQFVIPAGTNELQSVGPFDYEAKNAYTIQVRSTDAGGLSIERTLVIAIINVNEAPSGLQLADNRVWENLLGQVIGELTVGDPDVGQTHTWEVHDARFQIVGGTLKLMDDQFLQLTLGATVEVPITVTDSGIPAVSSRLSIVLTVIGNPFPWENAADPYDVNQNGEITPQDVLVVINEINSRQNSTFDGRLPPTRPASSKLPFFDVTGDGLCTPGDVLKVINYINARPPSGGEAEAISPPASRFPTLGSEFTNRFVPNFQRHTPAHASAALAGLGRRETDLHRGSTSCTPPSNATSRRQPATVNAWMWEDELEAVLKEIATDVLEGWIPAGQRRRASASA